MVGGEKRRGGGGAVCIPGDRGEVAAHSEGMLQGAGPVQMLQQPGPIPANGGDAEDLPAVLAQMLQHPTHQRGAVVGQHTDGVPWLVLQPTALNVELHMKHLSVDTHSRSGGESSEGVM